MRVRGSFRGKIYTILYKKKKQKRERNQTCVISLQVCTQTRKSKKKKKKKEKEIKPASLVCKYVPEQEKAKKKRVEPATEATSIITIDTSIQMRIRWTFWGQMSYKRKKSEEICFTIWKRKRKIKRKNQPSQPRYG
jgi:hypothetical protein